MAISFFGLPEGEVLLDRVAQRGVVRHKDASAPRAWRGDCAGNSTLQRARGDRVQRGDNGAGHF